MRSTAILASIVVGLVFGWIAGWLLILAGAPDATVGWTGIAGAATLPILVAQLVPRSARAQARHDRALGRIHERFPAR
jgi:hypothetical protein